MKLTATANNSAVSAVAASEPTPGLVIGYAYLWHAEARRGREAGGKDRPCAIVLSAFRGESGSVVTVASVTHRPIRRRRSSYRRKPSAVSALTT